MIRRLSLYLLLAASFLRADFSYDQSSKVTGGTAASKMKAAGASSEPIVTNVAVSGDRMVFGDDIRVKVIDLAKENITVIDFQAETWEVMTFAQISAALEEISKKAKENTSGDLQTKVSAAAGDPVILTAELKGPGAERHQTSHMSITDNIHMQPNVAGYREAADFLRRLSEKLTWSPDQALAMQTSILATTFGYARARRAAAEIFKEMAKLEGAPILQEIRMVDGPPVCEITSELSNFSTAPIEPARFAVPAGFRQVDKDLRWLQP